MFRNASADHSGHSSLKPLFASALALALLLSLAACSKSDDAGKNKPTQVAAKVGDSEISVHQINQILGRSPVEVSTEEARQAASQQVLERLIDQQVAVNAATEADLQRTPEVIAAIEAARRDVLARAYMQKFTAQAAKATPEDAARYFRENPALFAERRVFSLQEIRVPDASTVLPELRTLVAQGKSAEDISNLLRSKKVRFGGNTTIRTAEQIPLDLLAKIHSLRDGQSQVFESGKGATVIRVVSSQRAPMNEKDAAPVIEKFLNNKLLNEMLKKEVQRLRDATTISYLGEFSAPAAEATTPAAANGQPPAPAALTVADQDTLERGVKGLK